MTTATIRACAFREDPQIVVKIVDKFLNGASTGTMWMILERTGATEYEAEQRTRVEKWIKDRWEDGGDFADTVLLLRDFENFLITESTKKLTEGTKEAIIEHPAGSKCRVVS